MTNVDMLWNRYKRTGSVKDRNRIVEHYVYLVPRTALTMGLKQGTPVFEEYKSHGYLALINAVTQYDHDKKVPFEPYAVQRIKWGMADGARSYDHIPKRVRHKMTELEESYSYLREKLNKWPSSEETAEFMGITVDELNQLTIALNYDHTYTAHSNGVNVDSETIEVHRRNDEALVEGIPSHWWNPEQEFDVSELSQKVVDSMRRLSPLEKQFVYLYYVKDYTLKNTARELGVKETVSIKREAVQKMREDYWTVDLSKFS